MGRIRTAARILALGALPLAGLAWFTPGALASSKPVCPGPAVPGSARCFAHVLTDPHGNPSATTAPSGYGPAQFHGAYRLPNVYPGTAPAQTIAIVDAYDDPTIRNDLSVYDSIPRRTPAGHSRSRSTSRPPTRSARTARSRSSRPTRARAAISTPPRTRPTSSVPRRSPIAGAPAASTRARSRKTAATSTTPTSRSPWPPATTATAPSASPRPPPT